MNWMFAALLVLSCSGCTMTVAPIPKKHQAIHCSSKHTKTKPKPSTTIVDHSWLVQYQKLEEQHNYRILDDSKIEPCDNGKYKVTRSMLDHFRDLTVAPVSTPTPREY